MLDTIQVHSILHTGSLIAALYAFQDLKGELYGVSCAASGYHIAADDGGGGTEGGAFGHRAFLEAVETGELNPLEVVDLAKYQTWSGADGSHKASCRVMLLHKVHQGLAGSQVPGPRHSAREYDDVVILYVYAGLEGSVRTHGDVVR